MGSSLSSGKPRRPKFSPAEIRLATNNFSEQIGRGGFGKVYKGSIDGGQTDVAVKRRDAGSSQGRPEFDKEIETLTKIRHRNIVSLIGYCDKRGEMMLVYEYVANHTLHDHLHKLPTSLTWHQRISILIGAARGLHHLHDCIPGGSIIHRDVKSSNILLDEKFEAKVSDFGLAKNLGFDNSHVSTVVKGSYGYLDPSYVSSGGKLTRASDMYAFGVVVLEVLSGKLALDREGLLSVWALNREARDIVDRRVSGNISDGSLNICYDLAKTCLNDDPKERPKISHVLDQLQSALDKLELVTSNIPPPDIQAVSTQEDQILQVESNRPLVHAQAVVPAVEEDALQNRQTLDTDGELDKEEDVYMLPVEISGADILHMTANFSRKCGGSVFHGVLKTGWDVAIKRLNKNLPYNEFLEQVSTVYSLKHANVVELLHYCGDGDLRVLVYEFAPQGSLHDILHGQRAIKGFVLSWAERVEIAIGVARGLRYFHHKKFVHRNIKSSNVLLFYDGNAKISDLHLSTQCSCKTSSYRDEGHPHGFISNSDYHFPECAEGDQTKKGDVYSFGVLLLELLTGSKVLDHKRGEGPEHLVLWAKPQLGSENIHQIADARLEADYPWEAVEKMAELASSCLRTKPNRRPSMRSVVKALKNLLKLQELQRSAQEDQHLQVEFNRRLAHGQAVIPTVEEDALQNKQTADTDGELDKEEVVYTLPIAVSRADILRMTDNFSSKCGGNVFHGVLETGGEVAIKRVDKNMPHNEFLEQVSTIFGVKHENVVELLSYCSDGDLRVLLYEFAPHGSLHDILHGQRASVLSWAQRIKIAFGIARGLRYFRNKKLIHRNITSSNVLLFDDGNAKITNLHLSTQCSCKISYADERHPLGLISNSDYHPPECALGDQTKKGDVYSFGVLLLELLTGGEVIDHTRGARQEHLVLWATPYLGSQEVHKIVDARLREAEYPREAVEEMAALAARCVHIEPDRRPRMNSVFKDLENLLKPQDL